MSKFKKKTNASQEIPTSALPDIIFMLLFFFMVTTVLREKEIVLEQKLPDATEIKKLERKTLISHIYVGKPKLKKMVKYGKEVSMQLNDVVTVNMNEVIPFIEQQRSEMNEVDRENMIVVMKVDVNSKRGIVSDIEQELRKADARRLVYATTKQKEE